MKTFFGCLLATGLTAGAFAGPTTAPIYENWTSVTNVPQIDALAFANYGTFTVVTDDHAYDFMNTRFYTNRGVMQALPGFLFNTIDDRGFHSPAERFLNDNGSSVTAFGFGFGFFGAFPSVIRINAREVINRGVLQADPDGLLQIRGDTVNLSRGGIGIQPIITGSGFHAPPQAPTLYEPDEGLTDRFWGMSEQDPRFLSSSLVRIFQGTITANPASHCVTNALPGFCSRFLNSFTLNNPASFIYTNAVDDTNWIIQVVLVGNTDPYVNLQANFFPSSNPTNAFTSPAVQLESGLTNVLTGNNDSIALYLIDRLAAETNFSLLTNNLTGGAPLRPATLEWTRNLPIEFAFGRPPNSDARTNIDELIYNRGGQTVTNITTNYFEIELEPEGTSTGVEIVTNIVTTLGYAHDLVTNLYSGSGISLTHTLSSVPTFPGTSVTNAQGRVEIFAKSLNLERTRIRGEGHVTIQTDHLISSQNASVDVPSLFYSLGSTNGNLRLQSLVVPEIQRLAGSASAWNAVWTNTLLVVTNIITNITATNIVIDAESGAVTETVTNDPGTNILTTNSIQVGIHVLMVDGNAVLTRQSTSVNGIETYSTNVFVSDRAAILQNLRVDARRLTIDRGGSMLLGNPSPFGTGSGNYISDWKAFHFPNLRFLTNHGVISVRNQILMGATPETPYESIHVSGTNAAPSHRYRSAEFVNAGLIASAQYALIGTNVFLLSDLGPIHIDAGFAQFDGGRINAGGDLAITAGELKMQRSTNTATRSLILNVSGPMNDSGGGANVRFSATQGVHLTRKPASGALLGTTLELLAPRFQWVTSTWAAEDRGPTTAGYQDNAAIGRLILAPSVDGTLSLAGTGTQNGLYVDFLEIGTSALSDLENAVHIEPNLTLYFADSNMDYATLTNTFPGRMVWVGDFVGPNSRVAVLLNSGRTIYVNRGLRESTTIDSDGDGIANAFDLDPFGGVPITDFQVADGRLHLSWRAAAKTTYYIESTDRVPSEIWTVVREFYHDGNDVAEVSIEDPLPPAGAAHYYRVTYRPGSEL